MHYHRSFRDLFQFRVLWVVIWPMLAAVLMWLVLGVAFWDTFSGWIASGLAAIGIQSWLQGVEPRWVANAIQAVVHLILFVPLVFVTALVITALFAMPALIRLVADRHYPQLKRESGGSMAGSLLNALFAVGIFAAIWALTLPLWMIGAGLAVPFIAATYLNQRLFRYDALAEHASRKEMQSLFVDPPVVLVGAGSADRSAAVRSVAESVRPGFDGAGLHTLRACALGLPAPDFVAYRVRLQPVSGMQPLASVRPLHTQCAPFRLKEGGG